MWAGLRPEFVDVAASSHSIDAAELLAAGPPDDLGLIVPVHLWGRPCDTTALAALSTAWNVPLLYDAAHALGATNEGVPVGNFGVAEVLSFHATKWFTSIEGGAIVTNDSALAEQCRRLRNFGFAGEDDIPVNGINAKLSEMHAAVGLCQLERFDELRDINRQRFTTYETCFAGRSDVRVVPPATDGAAPRGYVVLELRPAEPVAMPSVALQAVLEAEGVHVRRYFSPGVHRLAAFRRFGPPRDLPVTDDLSTRTIALPTGESVTAEDVVTIAGLVLEGLDRLSTAGPGSTTTKAAGVEVGV